jgi:hypothetical protein
MYAAAGGEAPAVLTPPAPPGRFESITFDELLHTVRPRLLDIGMNLGGPMPAMARYKPPAGSAVLWTELIDWNATRKAYRANL